MPDKFIIHGAAFNGNGTSSEEATVDGGVGAWNSLNILDSIGTPNYGTGSLLAGDIVNIRSKDASGNDLVRTLSSTATLGSAAASDSNWITWVLDNGVIWPGVDGTLTYNCPSTYVVNIRNYNNYVAMAEDAIRIVEVNAAAYYKEYCGNTNSIYKLTNLLFDFSVTTSSTGCRLAATGDCTLSNLHIISRRREEYLIRCNQYNKLTLINPRIELLDATQKTTIIVVTGQTFVEVIGGSISGPGAVAGIDVFSVSEASVVNTIGFQVPKVMRFVSRIYQSHTFAFISAVGSEGNMGSVFSWRWGLADSRDDNNYPKLNATLPDTGNTSWSWKLCPANSSERFPLEMPMTQYYTESAAVKEITVNLLIATTLTNVSKQSVWMTVDYIDNMTGLKKFISTRAYYADVLDTSTADWTATTYGAASLLKRKLSAVTPTAIKPNTPITVVLWSTVKAASTTDELNDIMFLCPEFSVNTL